MGTFEVIRKGVTYMGSGGSFAELAEACGPSFGIYFARCEVAGCEAGGTFKAFESGTFKAFESQSAWLGSWRLQLLASEAQPRKTEPHWFSSTKRKQSVGASASGNLSAREARAVVLVYIYIYIYVYHTYIYIYVN